MNCQILFAGKNKTNVNLLSAKFAQRVLKIKVTKRIANIIPYLSYIYLD